MVREVTKEEAGWILAFERCYKKKPKTIEIFADGVINIVDSKDLEKSQKNPNYPFQPLIRTPFYCDGGDPWTI